MMIGTDEPRRLRRGAKRAMAAALLLGLGWLFPGGALAASVVALPGGQAPDYIGAGPGDVLWFDAVEPLGTKGPAAGENTFGHLNADGSATVVSQTNPTLAPNRTALNQPDPELLGRDGNFWSVQGNAVVRTTPAGTITAFPSPLSDSGQQQMVNGPDGDIWFGTSSARPGIGRVSPSGDATLLTSGVPGPTASVSAGRDRVWFSTDGGQIGSVSASGQVKLVSLPRGTNLGSPNIATAGNGDLWVVPHGFSPDQPILRVTPNGRVTRMCRDTGYGTVSGPESSIWYLRFIHRLPQALVRVAPNGDEYQYALPGVRVAGDDLVSVGGSLWVTATTGVPAPGSAPTTELLRVRPSEPSTLICHAAAARRA